MTDRKGFLQSQAAKVEEARRAELERRVRLYAKFFPGKWLSLRYRDVASLLVEQPKIIVKAPDGTRIPE